MRGTTRRRRFSSLAAVLLLLVVVAGCGSDSGGGGDLLEEIKERGFINVGAYSYPPYTELVSDEWTGFYAEFTDEIAKKIGVEVNVVFLTPAAFIPAVQSGRVDTVIGLSQTAQREQEVRFSEPMLWSIDCLMVKADSGIKGLEDLDGKTIGLTRGSAGETIANDKISAGIFTPGEIRTYDTYEAPLQDIDNGRIDAGIWDTIGAADAVKRGGQNVACIPISQDETGKLPDSSRVGWVFKKGSETDSLVKAFNDAQGTLQQDGTFLRILNEYGIDEPALLSGEVDLDR